MSSSSSSALNSNEQKMDWLDLPSDVTANILERIGVSDILENVQKVCTAWRKICKDPAMWRVINMKSLSSEEILMCKQAVDRSQGQLVDISIEGSCTDEILPYVANRSRQLRRLEILSFYSGTFSNISESPFLEIIICATYLKFPFLEELNICSTGVHMNKEFIETAGRYCPMLKTLKVNQTVCNYRYYEHENEVAIAIGKNLHELRHLELIGSNMTNTGLQAILDGCHHLEILDLRKCFKVDLTGDLGKRCFKQIKSLKLPNDFLKGSPYSGFYDEVDLETLDDGYFETLDDGYFSQ